MILHDVFADNNNKKKNKAPVQRVQVTLSIENFGYTTIQPRQLS